EKCSALWISVAVTAVRHVHLLENGVRPSNPFFTFYTFVFWGVFHHCILPQTSTQNIGGAQYLTTPYNNKFLQTVYPIGLERNSKERTEYKQCELTLRCVQKSRPLTSPPNRGFSVFFPRNHLKNKNIRVFFHLCA
ncbi:unnamed protein product, partial [Ectocarpus sp. 13 AM-2016]